MTTTAKAMGIGVLLFMVGASSGFIVRNQIARQHGAMFGDILRGVCTSAGYVGAVYPFDDPSDARCVTAEEAREFRAPQDR